jgi:hypothetical protein
MIAIRVSVVDAARALARCATSNGRATLRADSAERHQEASPSDRQECILALKELHAIGILQGADFLAEMKRVTDPRPRLDPTSPELPAHHQRRRRHTRVLTRRFSWSLQQVAGGLARSFSSSSG